LIFIHTFIHVMQFLSDQCLSSFKTFNFIETFMQLILFFFSMV